MYFGYTFETVSIFFTNWPHFLPLEAPQCNFFCCFYRIGEKFLNNFGGNQNYVRLRWFLGL